MTDPRQHGSGNPGATNVLRSGNKLAAALTLFGDAFKGVIPVLLAKYLNVTDFVLALVLLATILGHLYPIFFKFKGGKGIATTIGVLLASNWQVGILFLFVWGTIAAVFKISSLAAMVAIILLPLFGYFLMTKILFMITIVISILLIWRHRDNIRRLLKNEES